MKKHLSLVLALVMLISCLLPVQALAASYPLISLDYTDSDLYIMEDDKGLFVFNVYSEYSQCKYYINIYNDAGKKVASASDTFFPTVGKTCSISVSIDAKELELIPGAYELEYYLAYSSGGSWYPISNRHSTAFEIISNVCNGNHKYALQTTLEAATCTTDGRGRYLCTVCNYPTIQTLPAFGHTLTNTTITVPPTPETEGEKTSVCSVCDKTVIEVIPTSAAVKITTQPKNTFVKSGSTAKVTVKATGDGLTYRWYYKNPGASKFTYTSSFTGSSYSVKMSTERAGRQLYCEVTDAYGNTERTKTVSLGISGQLILVKQPQDTAALSGKKATVTVEAVGEGLKYQWYYAAKGSSKFAKASIKTATYSIEMNSSRAGRKVYCVITDKYGNKVTTDTVTLSKATALKITTQPKDVAVVSGKTASVTVKAQGDGLTYQWYYAAKGSSKFTKASVKTATYSVSMNSSRAGRQVYCVITDKYGNQVTTDTVTLNKATALKITTQPKDAAALNGETVSVTVKAQGDGLTYQWYYAAKGSSKFAKASIKTATYSVEMNSSRAGRKVYCVITDKYGNKMTTNTVTLGLATPLKITAQPEDVIVASGKTASVTVAAQGDGLTYQWYYAAKGSSKFAKASIKTATYSVEMSSSRAGRQIYCVITDKYGNKVTSDTVTLNLPKELKIITQPASVTVYEDEIATVTVAADGDDLQYAWYYADKDSSTFTKAPDTTNTYTQEMSCDYDGRKVYCVISDQHGNTVTSNTVTLFAKPISATIVQQTDSAAVVYGETGTISIQAKGHGLQYQWYYAAKDAAEFTLLDATAAEFTFTMDFDHDGSKVYCVVTDQFGNTDTSEIVTISLYERPLPEGMTYEILINTAASITAYTGTDTSVVIPSTIEGYPVRMIGSVAFSNARETLTSVSIPATVITINDYAFYECYRLTSITLPGSVKNIKYGAFAHCTGLTSISLPSSVTTIGDHAFEGCWNLTSISIPESVTSMGSLVFYECDSLQSIIVKPDSYAYQWCIDNGYADRVVIAQ